MPLYEYQCESCAATFEVIQKFSDPSVGTCRACGGKVQRLFSAPAIQFKGTGWYVTDYARKGASGSDSEKSSASSDGSGTGADKPAATTDAKGATTTPSSPSPAPATPATNTTASSDKK